VLGALVFGTLLLVYLFTGSLGALIGTALVLVVATPVLVLLIIDRSRP
jgi:hypothetical protein